MGRPALVLMVFVAVAKLIPVKFVTVGKVAPPG